MSRSHPDRDLFKSRKFGILLQLDDVLRSLSSIDSKIKISKMGAESIPSIPFESKKPRQEFYVDSEKYLTEVDTVEIPGSSNRFDQVLETLSDLKLQIQELKEHVEHIGTEKPRQRFYNDPFLSDLEVVHVDPPTDRRRL